MCRPNRRMVSTPLQNSGPSDARLWGGASVSPPSADRPPDRGNGRSVPASMMSARGISSRLRLRFARCVGFCGAPCGRPTKWAAADPTRSPVMRSRELGPSKPHRFGRLRLLMTPPSINSKSRPRRSWIVWKDLSSLKVFSKAESVHLPPSADVLEFAWCPLRQFQGRP